MTFGSEMRETASELVNEFASETGTSTVKHLSGSTYDVTTGAHSSTYEEYPTYIVFEEIKYSEVNDATFIKEHLKATLAGADIPVTVAVNDIVVREEKQHVVVKVMDDMYNAAQVLYIERKPIDA